MPFLPFHFTRLATIAVLLAGLTWVPTTQAFSHDLLDGLLRAHVADGRVNYAGVRTDPRLDAYLTSLASADVTTLTTRDERLAFWINAYNAYTLKLVAVHYPVKSIKDVPLRGAATPWDLPIARVAGRRLTLNHIEHQILRAELREPRIHYAVVCAALSCPPLRSEAYVAARLDAQLAEQASRFLASLNRFDGATRHAQLSQIFNWFADDFGGPPAAVLATLAPHAPAAVRASLTTEAAAWRVTHLDYDWSLNDRKP